MCCREVRFSSYLCMTKEILGWPHFSADFPCLAKVRKTYPSGTMCRSRGVRQVVAEGYAKWKEAFRVRFVGLSRHIRIGCRCGTCHPRCRDRRRCSSGCCHVGGYPMSIRRWHRWSMRWARLDRDGCDRWVGSLYAYLCRRNQRLYADGRVSVVLFYKCKKAGEYLQPFLYYNFGGTIADNHFILYVSWKGSKLLLPEQ